MKGRVVLAKREALLKLLADEAAGKDDEGGTRAQVLGPMANQGKRGGLLANSVRAARQLFRRKPRST
jgi:hypothetical protein